MAAAPPTRVAVVQLAYHPAAIVGGRSPLCDPLFEIDAGASSLAPREGARPLPADLAARLRRLGERVRAVHGEQVLGKALAVLEACRGWGVRLVVFPEYSLACELLPAIAAAAGEMVVVAGSHAVDRAALAGGVYRGLSCPEDQVPRLGEAVCPVLFGGRILALQPKLQATAIERGALRIGERWRPIDLPEEAGLPGPIGAVIGLDSLAGGGPAQARLLAPHLGACRLLAVAGGLGGPALAGSRAREASRRSGRPIAHAGAAEAGGSAIFAGAAEDDAPFPEGPGTLPAGDEGVIVADVDLHDRGAADRATPRIVPHACASLVYRTHPHGDAFAGWIETLHAAIAALPADDHAALFEILERVDERRQFLLDAGGLPGAISRGGRYEALLRRLGAIQSGEALARLTREVILPPTILPFEHVREAMSLGAHEALHGWWQEAGGADEGPALMEIAHRLKAAGEALRVPPPEMWTEAGRRTIDAIRGAIVGDPPDRDHGAGAGDDEAADDLALATDEQAPDEQAPDEETAREEAAEEVAAQALAGTGDPLDLVGLRDRVLADLAARRRRKLADVYDHYEPPDLLADGESTTPALAALDAWLADDDAPRALLLGEPGVGKSTLLTVWIERRWRDGGAPLPVLVPLPEAVPGDDALALILRALGRGGDAAPRDRLAHLLRDRALAPCFDGLDEYRGAQDEADLAARLRDFAAIAGKVLVAAGDRVLGDDGLARALPGARRLILAPLSPAQIARLIGATPQGDGAARKILRRLAHAYDLADLVRRPLLLGMVLQSLDALDPSARINATDVFNTYIGRWEQDGDLPIAAAEALADELWRSGRSTCPIRQLHRRLLDLAEGPPAGPDLAALERIESGSVLVREGDALRFAHLSFLEFFLARGLVRRMGGDPEGRLATQPLTPAVMRFVDELLRREFGDPLASPPIQALRGWLVGGAVRRRAARSVDPRVKDPRVNALRLLRSLAMAESSARDGAPPDARAWLPAGARLGGIDLRGEDLRHARLVELDLRGADLRGADLRGADLRGSDLTLARLEGADLRGAKIDAEGPIGGAEAGGARSRADPTATATTCAERADRADRADRAGIDPLTGNEPELEEARGFDAFGELEAEAPRGEIPAPIEIAGDEAHALPRGEAQAAEPPSTRSLEGETPPTTGPRAGPSPSPPPARPSAPREAPTPAPSRPASQPAAAPEPVPKAIFDDAPRSRALAGADLDDAPAPAASSSSTLDTLLRKLSPSKAPIDPQKRLRDKLAERGHALAPNPFLPGRPLREATSLPGREDILAELTTLIHQRSPALLKGPRRAGKSSILYTLAQTEGERRRVYHRSLEGKAPRDPAEFAALVDPVFRDSKDPADALVGSLEAAAAPPLILLDEVAWLTRADEGLFPWLRVLGQEGLCSLVLAGSHSDWLAVIRVANRTPGSSFGNDYTIVELEALREADAIAFLVDTAPDDVEIDRDRGARWIVELCGGWPFYLQVMGYAVVEEARQGKRAPLVDKGALFDLYERRLLRDRVAVFSSRWADLRRPAQEVMLAVLERTSQSKGGRALTPYRDLGRRERALLSDAGVIDGQRGWLLDNPFRDWLLRNFDELEVSDGEAL